MLLCLVLYFIEKENVNIYDQVRLRGWNFALVCHSDRF